MSKNFIITLNRECGAGATNIAKLLSKELDIPYYDKDMFRMVSDKSGVLEEFFHVNDERPGNNLLYKLIKELAENESCIIIGRCADYVLKDYDNVVNIFVCGDMESKIHRMMWTFSLEKEVAEERIRETDKQRHKYYNYYTGKTWDTASNYDLCLNTGDMTIEEAAEQIKLYLKQKGLMK